MPPGFTKSFADRLSHLCKFKVKEAEEEDVIATGQALLAPGGFHMIVGNDKKVHLNTQPTVHGVRPAVDPMMETASEVYGSESIGVLLTGMGKDGAIGMKRIKEHGGATIAQDKESSTIFGMPKAAIDEGCVDKVMPLSQIAQEIVRRYQD
jgi:two-component system chemotaxis response regulator CheB